VAALDPKSYTSRIQGDISVDPAWVNAMTRRAAPGRRSNSDTSAPGDTGGAPVEESVQNMEKAIANPQGQIEIRNTARSALARSHRLAERRRCPATKAS